jgi:hypothetical protein
MDGLPGTLTEFQTWVGTAAGFAFFIALVLERIPWLQKQSAGVKMGATLVLVGLLGALSYGLTTYVPAGVIQTLEPLYRFVLNLLGVFGLSQGFHWADKFVTYLFKRHFTLPGKIDG